MFIIDFDDTLFDTQAFKQKRFDALAAIGVSENMYWESYGKARNTSDGLFTYSNERHAHILEEYGFSYDEVLTALEETSSDNALQSLLFEDTILFLESIKKYLEPMVLLSLGDSSFQELKTKGTGVTSFFDKVYFVNEKKEQTIRHILQNKDDEHVWFINDKIDETVFIAKEFPQIHSAIKMAKHISKEEYASSGIIHFQTLTEIAQYVKEQHST